MLTEAEYQIRILKCQFDIGHLQLAGYKVKCMLAEPKGKRGRADSGGGSLDNGVAWGQVPVHLAVTARSVVHAHAIKQHMAISCKCCCGSSKGSKGRCLY
jgi:hypothetical protein